MAAKSLRVCPAGHRYYKTSDCPTCPHCEKGKKPKVGFLSVLAAPARRALEAQGIKTLKQLSAYREEEILALHGFGPSSLPILRAAMASEGYQFRK